MGKYWCEHIKWSKDSYCYPYKRKVLDEDQFCCICGTPRPKPEPLRERLAQALYDSCNWNHGKTNWLTLADAAIKFLEDEKNAS